MSTTTKPLYGSNNQSITITFTSLANNGARSGLAIDNSTSRMLDASVTVKIKSGASSTTASGLVNVYVYASSDGGTSYPEGCGTDTGITLTSPTNLKLLGVVNVVANATTYISEPMYVAAAFNALHLPAFWGIAIENKTGATLDASVGSAFYQGSQLEGL